MQNENLKTVHVYAEKGLAMPFGNAFLKFLRFFFVFVHIYPPFTRKRIVSLYFGRDVRTRLGVAIF